MSDRTLPNLLSPVRLGKLDLANRVVMAPLTRSRAGEGDAPTDLMATYYRQRASAELIITEASQISPQAKGYPRTPGNFSDGQVAGWRRVTEAVHYAGGRIFLQIWHVGRLSHSVVQPDGGLPVAPSAIAAAGEIITTVGMKQLETPRALGTSEIPGIVEQFRHAASNADRAGFDGVEIHAANGYLIDQFLRDGTNHRDDAYGGTLENRSRLLKEVVEAAVQELGADRVGVRISPVFDGFSMHDSDPDAIFGHVAGMLSAYGLAYLHVLQGGKDGKCDFAALKASFGGPYIANSGYTAQSAEAAIASGTADLVSFGAPFIANPDLVERFRIGAPLAVPDPQTFYQGEERGYTDYPVYAPASAGS